MFAHSDRLRELLASVCVGGHVPVRARRGLRHLRRRRLRQVSDDAGREIVEPHVQLLHVEHARRLVRRHSYVPRPAGLPPVQHHRRRLPHVVRHGELHTTLENSPSFAHLQVDATAAEMAGQRVVLHDHHRLHPHPGLAVRDELPHSAGPAGVRFPLRRCPAVVRAQFVARNRPRIRLQLPVVGPVRLFRVQGEEAAAELQRGEVYLARDILVQPLVGHRTHGVLRRELLGQTDHRHLPRLRRRGTRGARLSLLPKGPHHPLLSPTQHEVRDRRGGSEVLDRGVGVPRGYPIEPHPKFNPRAAVLVKRSDRLLSDQRQLSGRGCSSQDSIRLLDFAAGGRKEMSLSIGVFHGCNRKYHDKLVGKRREHPSKSREPSTVNLKYPI